MVAKDEGDTRFTLGFQNGIFAGSSRKAQTVPAGRLMKMLSTSFIGVSTVDGHAIVIQFFLDSRCFIYVITIIFEVLPELRESINNRSAFCRILATKLFKCANDDVPIFILHFLAEIFKKH